MAENKRITLDWDTTGLTVYCIVRREVDDYRLNDADGSFVASPADPYVSLTEDSVIKSRYEKDESRTVWDDGKYTVAIYNQAGGSPTPVSDVIIGTGEIVIKSDLEVFLDSIMRGTDSAALDATVAKESTLGTHETNRATMETTLVTGHGLLQNGIDNIEGGVLRIQTSLVDQVLVPSGNNWVKVVVLVNDNLGALFDPADIVDPSGSPVYNGVGAKFSDIDDDQVIMYKDDIGTPLDQVNLCAHAPQANKPQILERDAHGLYYYWMNATIDGNVLPVGQLKTLFALFDITQAAATYSGTSPFLLQDTDPTSHLHILFSVNILAEAGITEKLNTIIADVQHATYGLSAIQVLIDALDTSTEMQTRFDQIKGAGWTDETLKALSEFVDDLETRITQNRADGMPPATMGRV